MFDRKIIQIEWKFQGKYYFMKRKIAKIDWFLDEEIMGKYFQKSKIS